MKVTTLLRLATATITVAVASGLALAAGSAAHADVLPTGQTPGVASSCSTLTVKPKGFADKGEVRVVVDGEVQTDGSAQRDAAGDDWRVFKGSFTGVYDFDPRVAHRYSVEINSWSATSDGRTFTTGTGSDVRLTGTTTPCAPVSVQVTPSNCTAPSRVDKQGLDLTIGALRRSTTYLVEVSTGGSVVTHFQFRTQPEVSKHFSGLTAGLDYDVRVTDQSDDSLSTVRRVTIPGCAAKVGLEASVSQCGPDQVTRTLTTALDSLVVGRSYYVALTSDTVSTLPVVSFVGDGDAHSVAFSGVSPGTYRVTVSDDAAPRTTRSGAIVVDACSSTRGPATPPVPGTPSGGTAEGSGAGSPPSGQGPTTATAPVPVPASATPSGSASAIATATTGPTVAWASRPDGSRTSVVTVTADGSPVHVASPGHADAARPGVPTAVDAAGASASPPVAVGLLVAGSSLAIGGAAAGALRRRRLVR